MREELKKAIRSYYPGRLRLRHEALKGLDKETQELICSTVKAADGITDCVINPVTGSLLLTWNPKVLTEEALLNYFSFWEAFLPEGVVSLEEKKKVAVPFGKAHIFAKSFAETTIKDAEELTVKGLDLLAPLVAPDQGKSARKRRVTQNRLMLLSLMTCVGGAWVSKSAHTALGLVFASLLAVHLYQHRRVI